MNQTFNNPRRLNFLLSFKFIAKQLLFIFVTKLPRLLLKVKFGKVLCQAKHSTKITNHQLI